MKQIKIDMLKKCTFLAFIIIAITIVISIIIKYNVEGEVITPYYIEKILIISRVNSQNNEDSENLWNISLAENNDIFISLKKDNNSTTDTIKNIKINNFKIISSPQIGKICVYRPTGDLSNLYEHSEQNYLDGSIIYTGARVDTLKTLEIGNEGGMIGFRISLEDIGKYISNNYEEEIVHDGSLLTKAGIPAENIKFSISFDLTINLNNDIGFQGTVNLNLPSGDIINEKEPYIELTDFSDVVFKRL